ncbi:MAG: oligopeptide transporter, OPT family [Clostridia bacterium]|nr:oligopeptide transporter, OPT family [Clostridia bacterium]
MNDKNFKPYVPADKVMPELTPVSLILGVILAVLFGGANAYLGLRVGMTVSASIPAAVVSMGIIRKILRRDSILENNMVQTIGSAGESLAAGAIFTLPALFMWAGEGLGEAPSLIEIGIIALCGGILGVLLMVPLRSSLIVKEHGVLAYPEGKACAEVLIAGEEGGSRSVTVFSGLSIAAVYKFITDGLRLFPSEVDFSIGFYKGAGIGMDVLPALAGVGYICGARVASYLLAGGITAWFVLMPVMALFGSNAVIFPAEMSVAELWESAGTWGLWKNYVRYIGAGGVAAGGIISLIKSLPLIVRTFIGAIGGYGGGVHGAKRTERDIPMGVLGIGIAVIAVLMWLIPVIPVNLLGAVIIIIFGFFFATVSSRMVGLVGSSNNPVSGMAIATLLISAFILKLTGAAGVSGMTSAIVIGSFICIISAIAGDASQDLKTGFLIGSTPLRQQLGEIIGCVFSALAIGGILYILNKAWGYGSNELPAPQAMLMKLVVEGVMDGNLPWALVFTGVFLAIAVEILGIPVLPYTIGLYLPIHLSLPIMAGGLVRLFLEKRKYKNEAKKGETIQAGVLYSSGMIAGEGIVGILLAVFAIIPIGSETLGDYLNISESFSLGNAGGLIFFAALILTMLKFTLWNKSIKK